ncbi:MAG: sodium:solute symporter family protein [candidate division KSB1 bacterium]
MPPSFYYWCGFTVYSVVVIAVGYFSYRKQARVVTQNFSQDFWTASHTLSGWASGLSISASMMSISWSCVYGVQLFYWYGVGGLWLLGIPWLLAMLGFFILAPRLRKLQAFSQPEMVGQRFGARARQLLAVPLAFVYMVWCGAELYAAAQILTPLFDTNFYFILFLMAFVVATYSAMGGLAADVSTDQIQFVLVAFFITAIAYLGSAQILEHGGFAMWMNNLPAPPKAHAPATSLFSTGFALLVMTFIAYLPGWLVTTDVWIRMQASRSTAEARKGVLIAAANSFLFVAIGPMIIGLAALFLYPPQGLSIPPELANGEKIFAVLMQDYAPVWLNVLLTVGLAAAAMSTVDTTGNVLALSLSYDLLEPATERRLSPAMRAKLPRLISIGAIAVAFSYALVIESLWDIFYLSSGILTTTVFIPMMALFRPQTQPRQVHAAIVAGFVGTLLFYFLEARQYLAKIEPEWLAATELGYILWGLLTALFAFFASGLRGKKT